MCLVLMSAVFWSKLGKSHQSHGITPSPTGQAVTFDKIASSRFGSHQTSFAPDHEIKRGLKGILDGVEVISIDAAVEKLKGLVYQRYENNRAVLATVDSTQVSEYWHSI